MSSEPSQAVSVARDYYDSDDADRFYHTIWGGEDIHVGLYESANEPIPIASRRTVEQMAATVQTLGPQSHVLDIGAGYGGAARSLAEKYGCRVTALNLSSVENQRHRQLNCEQDLDDQIDVVDGNFEDLPFDNESFNLVWSQDAFLHSERRGTVLAEAARVLKPGGELVFTDPMQADGCSVGELQPIFDRLHLESLGSPEFYRKTAQQVGLEELGFDQRTEQLVNHYRRVLEETEAREAELSGQISSEYLERMQLGLGHWIDGGRRGLLCWGIFHFQK